MKNNLHDAVGMTSDLKRMVLNPDVTVRAKGVIEKCSFCTQRIQEKKLLNDEKSEISKLFKSNRKYSVLEELNTKPSVGYLTKVRNIKS
jgi:molybdopterin-containing oxidoreductase family iron-sulfur binding subunit